MIPDETTRLRVESVLPPMRHLWREWRRVLSGQFDPEDEGEDEEDAPPPPPWEEDGSETVRQLMQQVMVEGGLMSSAPCASAVSDCSFGDCCAGARRILTDREGPCYRIRTTRHRTAAEAEENGDQRYVHFPI